MLFNRLTEGGKHAYGWMASDGAEVWYQKHYGRADTTQAFENAMNFADDIDSTLEGDVRYFIGHTRYATTGKPEVMANNHPLVHGNIMGVHNGKVFNYERILEKTGREDPKASVDSEAIFAAVNKYGRVKGLERLVSDMVAIFTDLRSPNRFYIARSANRDLVIGFTERGNIIFATERRALEALHPMVRFKSFSAVKTGRLLTIEDGKIIARRDVKIRSSAPVVALPPVRRTPLMDIQREYLDDFWDEDLPSDGIRTGGMGNHYERIAAAERLADRAVRRGRALFDLPPQSG